MAFITIPDAKAQAGLLQKRLNELGVPIKRTQAIEGVAAIHNFHDWNRFKARLEADSASAPRSRMKETKILVAPPGYGKSSTMETIFTFHAMSSRNSIPVYIELVRESYRPAFFDSANKYLGGTDTQPCIQLTVSCESLQIDIHKKTRALYVQVPVSDDRNAGAQNLATAIRNIAEAFRRCDDLTPGIILIDEMHKVYETSDDLKSAFEHAFESCKNIPERLVIATQVWDVWLPGTIKGALKVIYKKTGCLDDKLFDLLRHREVLSDKALHIQELFQDDERIIEDLFQWFSLGIKDRERYPVPDTPIAQALRLNRRKVDSAENSISSWRQL